MKLKKLANWLKTVTSRTPEQMNERKYFRYLKILGQNPLSRTFRGTTFIGRNDPCYCGNVYAGRVWRDKAGDPILNNEGKMQERPVKFKHCCQKKHRRQPNESST